MPFSPCRFLFFLLCSLVPLAACAADPPPEVLRQEIRVRIDPQRHSLQGETIVHLTAPAGKVAFDLSPAAGIEGVSVAGRQVSHVFDHGKLTVPVPAGTGKGAVPVTIAYRASYNDPVAESPVSSEDPTYGVAGSISERGVFLGSDAGWYPQPRSTPKRRTIDIDTPAGMEAITSGKRVSRSQEGGRSRSVWEELRPVGELSLSAGPYRIEERHVAGIAVYSYLYPENAGLASRYLDAAARYLAFYSDLFGPYPFEKFAVVENFFPTGYGFPSYTLLGSTVIRLPFIVDTSFPHEIAHNWWGNGVLVDIRVGNWCEGLVTYLADHLLEEKKSAALGRDYRLRLLADYSSLVTPDRDFPLQDFKSRNDAASRAIGYGKGAMVFHMVRRAIGDDAFFDALRQLFRDRVYGSAGWSDFTSAFSRRAGTDLSAFMEQWLTRPGGPHLRFDRVETRRDGAGWIVSGVVVQGAPDFRAALPLQVETEGVMTKEKIALAAGRTPFSIKVSALPRRLQLDPDVDLFHLFSPRELPPTVNRIKGAEKLVVVRTKGCKANGETLKRLLQSLGQPQASVAEENGADLTGGKDMLVCGLPENAAILPRFPGTIDLSSTGFTVGGKRYDGSDDLLFAVGQRADGGVTGLFLPLSEKSAERYVLKITHYGKYGYLVFAGGENRQKGMFPPVDGTMVELAAGK